MATTTAAVRRVVPTRGRRRFGWLVPLLGAALLALGPAIGMSADWQVQVIFVAVLAMVTSGFNLAFGYAGEIALGQVALYAVGTYVGGIMQVRGADFAFALVGAAAASMLVAMVISIPGLRLGGWGLAMVSFMLVVAIPDLTEMLPELTGGLNGLVGIPPPMLFGVVLSSTQFYLVVLVVAVLWFAVARNFVVTRHGHALRVLRQSPVLAASLGINSARLKLTTYALGGISAGLAGCVLAGQQLFVVPDVFNLQLVIAVVATSVLGGSESVYGAILGAIVIQLGPMRMTAFHDYALVGYGVLLVVCGVFFRGGLARLGRMALDRWDRWRPPATVAASGIADSDSDPVELPHRDGLPLTVDSVVKRFGGSVAVDGVSFTARPGRVTGLIGANGSGKTTMLNLIGGYYRPTSGTIRLGEQEIGGHRPHRIARLGVGRTFQTPLIPTSMTSLEVVAAARFSGDYIGVLPTVLRLPGFRRVRRQDAERGLAAMRVLDIEHLAGIPASSLSLGNRRLVEVARALCATPGLVLLDEPASGLDENEVRDLENAIRAIRANGATVILVEHNFRLICDVSDDIYVLELGKVIADGDADAIRSSAAVARSYLGEDVADETAGPQRSTS